MSKSSAKQSEVLAFEDVVNVKRVTKVVKGGRKFSFSTYVVVGNGSGQVGYGHGKAKEVGEARTKAVQAAKKNMVKVPLYQGTIHHDVMGRFGASSVILRRAKPGTGVIAGGAMRLVFEALGIHDIVAKSLGSSNVSTLIRATLNALESLCPPKIIAAKRDKKLSEISHQAKGYHKSKQTQQD